MSERKFHVGNAVEYRPPNGIWGPKGTYIVTADLPVVAGEFHYQIKTEPHQRSARESELNGQQHGTEPGVAFVGRRSKRCRGILPCSWAVSAPRSLLGSRFLRSS
jgi:hypothetical protein